MLSKFSKKYPALLAAIPLLAGILISSNFKLNFELLPLWLFLLIIIFSGLLIALLYSRSVKNESFLGPYITLILLFGVFSFQYRFYKTDPENITNKINSNYNNSILKGIISEQPDINNDRIRFPVETESVNDSAANGLVLVSVYKNKYKEDFIHKPAYGDIVELKGRLELLPEARNPGEFDYGRYLKLHGIDAVFTSYGFENITLSGHDDPDPFQSYVILPVKEHSIRTIDELIGGDEGEYLKGLLLGERSNISKEMKQNFINAGVAHIIAVSGLNVAYVILIIYGVLIFIPVRHSFKIFFTITCLIFYMDLTGNTPSIVRAVIMASVFLVSRLAERRPDSYNIIGFAALVILVIDPRQLFDAGFILSFSAILSLVVVYPVLDRWINNIKWYKGLNNDKFVIRILKGAVALVTGTLAAQLGTLPITAIMFKKISIVSLVANLFAIPLSNIALAIGFIMVIFSSFSLWLASVFASVNSALLYFQIWLIEICAKWDYAFVETYFVDSMMFLFYYIILSLILTFSIKNYIPRIAIILILAFNFIIWKEAISKTDEAELTYLYSGKSNSTLIRMPEGTSVLINAGTSNEKYNSAERTIIPYLKSNMINKIDLLILNSLDKNEFRNLLYLVSNFNVSKIFIPVHYRAVLNAKRFSGNFSNTKIEYVTGSRIINRKGNFRIYLYYDSLLAGSTMMTQFLFGDQSFVFNDAVIPVENIYNSVYLNKLDLSMQVLRVTGSGTYATTTAGFITEVDPEYILIGETITGRKKVNSVIFAESLNDFGYNILNVGNEGAVILRTNGDFTRRVVWK